MILSDKGRKLVEGVNEDAMRLALRLERAAGKAAEAAPPPQP